MLMYLSLTDSYNNNKLVNFYIARHYNIKINIFMLIACYRLIH